MRHEELASALPEVVRVDEQRFDRVAAVAEESDRRLGGGNQDPPVDGVACQLRGDERAESDDITVREKGMRGPHGPLPQFEQPLAILRPGRSHVHGR